MEPHNPHTKGNRESVLIEANYVPLLKACSFNRLGVGASFCRCEKSPPACRIYPPQGWSGRQTISLNNTQGLADLR